MPCSRIRLESFEGLDVARDVGIIDGSNVPTAIAAGTVGGVEAAVSSASTLGGDETALE